LSSIGRDSVIELHGAVSPGGVKDDAPKVKVCVWCVPASLLIVVVVTCCLCIPASAGPCPLITVDENGNGTLDFSAGGGCASGTVATTAGALAPDPGPGGLGSVLTYSLLGPPSLVAGDVLLTDADFGGAFLDVIRFNPAGTSPGNAASLLFYSDNVDGFDSLGDTSSPPRGFYTNVVTIPELGTETNNGRVTLLQRVSPVSWLASMSPTISLATVQALHRCRSRLQSLCLAAPSF
jgi:hypothetical protein